MLKVSLKESFVETAKEPHYQFVAINFSFIAMHAHAYHKKKQYIILVEFLVTNYLKLTLSFYRDYRNLPAALECILRGINYAWAISLPEIAHA